jgi:hypothetical protein
MAFCSRGGQVSSSSSGAEERDVMRACEDLMTSEEGLVSFVGRM